MPGPSDLTPLQSQWQDDLAALDLARQSITALQQQTSDLEGQVDQLEAQLAAAEAGGQIAPGWTKPGASNTGITNPTNTIVTQSVTYSTAQVITDTRFENWVSVTGPGVIFINCEFVGPLSAPTSSRGLVMCSSSGVSGLLLINCTICPRQPHRLLTGIYGHHFTTIACDISRVTDGFGIYLSSGAASVVRDFGSWVHDLAWFTPAPEHSDNKTHNDCVQFHVTARDIHFLGTNFDATIDPAVSSPGRPANALSVMMANVKQIENVTFDRVWASHGDSLFNFGPTTNATGSIVIKNSVLDYMSTTLDVNVFAKPSLPITITGNVTPTGASANGRSAS